MTDIPAWISEADLRHAIDNLVTRANNAKRHSDTRMRKNVVDPFSSLIVASTLNIDSRDSYQYTTKCFGTRWYL